MPTQVDALKVDETCTKAEIIFARGSGNGDPKDDETNKYISFIKDRLKDTPFSSHDYALGTEAYGGYKYPHVEVGNYEHPASILTAIGAAVSGGQSSFDYGNSTKNGVGELGTYLIERYNKCKSSGSYYILGGYSQGAQVVGQTLQYLPKEIQNRIIYVGLFGDPKLYYPEGDYFTNVPACRGIRSVYRKGPIVNCLQYQGSLGYRKPYLPDDMKAKTGLWCHANDFICGSSPFLWDISGHKTYKNEGGAIDQAAQEAAQKLAAAISKEPKPHPSPSPTPDPSKSIDTKRKKGTGITGQDIVFVIDAEDSMKTLLPSTKQFIATKGAQILQLPGGRISFAQYGGGLTEDGPPLQPEDTTKGLLNYGQWLLDNMSTVDKVHAPRPDSPIFVLQTVLDYMDWRPGATKATILITNKTNLDDSSTFAAIAKRALAIDPVNVYPIVPEGAESTYQKLADLTSGQVTFYSDGDFEAAANAAFDKIQDRPVPFLTNTEYIADPGQEITFDASDSYVIDSEITKYDWDFDGDGTFEASTTDPIIHHTYTQKGDGIMQVRVTAANGLIANASATLKIGTYIPPALPQTPQNLKASVIETQDGKSTVRLTWDSVDDDLTAKLVLSANGVMLGTMTPDRTSIDITDIDRLIDVDFSLAGMTDAEAMGPAAFTSLASSEPIVFPSIVTSDPEEDTVIPTSYTQNSNPQSVVKTNAASPTESPDVLGAQTAAHSVAPTNNSSENTPSHINNANATSNLDQLWWLLVPGTAAIAGIAWAIIRRRH